MNKTALTALAAIATVAAIAGPAAAQSWDHRYDGRYENRYEGRYDGRYDGRYEGRYDRDGDSIDQRQAELNRDIQIGIRRGQISPSEARQLTRESNEIARLEARYRYNGLSGWERGDLNGRLGHLQAAINLERHDREYGYGYYR